MSLSRRFSPPSSGRSRKPRKRAWRLETLESRIALAADCFGAVEGTVGVDTNSNSTIDAGEEISGATIQLYQDSNGNNSFDVATDTLVTSTTTDASGAYQFTGLATGNYFVVQPAQTVGATALDQSVSARLAIDGSGAAGPVIDDFATASGPTVDSFPAGTPVEEVHTAAEAIGGERDFVAELTAGTTDDTVAIRTATNRLLVNPDLNAIGTYTVVWDGADNAGDGISFTGLGGVDLTEIGGVSGRGEGLALSDVTFDQAGATITVRVYTDASNFSETALTGFTPLSTEDFFLEFANFTNAGGTGADFTNVGAVELEIVATSVAMDGELSQLGVIGADPATTNFVNSAPVPAIDIQKFTNGNQADNATDADVPVINVNTTSTVTWTYVVTNTGQSALESVQLTDDRLGTIPATNITDRSINADDVLDVGEIWTYEVTGVATVGNYTNIGTISANSVDTAANVTDTDPSNYVGIAPGIDIEKATNGADADLITSADVPQITSGGSVTWTYVVTNTGSDPLTNIQVTDDQLGSVSTITNQGNGDTTLDVGESWTFQATGIAQTGNYENQGTVVGTALDNSTVTDADLSHYVGVTSAINVEKATNGIDADTVGSGPQVVEGATVTFSYVVTNTGQVPLTNVTVADDNGTPTLATDDFFATFVDGDTDGDSQLDLAETWNFTATRTATLGAYQNIATASGIDDVGNTVNATDPSNHTGIAAATTLSKRRWLASAFG